MKQLKKDLQALLKSLKQATEKTENLMKKLEELDKPHPSKKPKSKALPKPKAQKEVSESDMVFTIIRRYKKGVDGATLREKTGFEGRKIGDIIYRLKKRGKIKSVAKGVYVKA